MNELAGYLEQVRIGEPQTARDLTIFPLFGPEGGLDYVLLDEALKARFAVITENPGGESVPELLLRNDSEHKVLIVEGDELIGALQNRIVNATILVPERCKLVLPVSCCEAGRWQPRSRTFASAGTRAPHRLRTVLSRTVRACASVGRGFHSDQQAVWGEVACCLSANGVASPTQAMHDVWERRRRELDDLTRDLCPANGQTGIAIARDGEMTIDIFDRADTLSKLFARLISAFALTRASLDSSQPLADATTHVDDVLKQIAVMRLQSFPSVGIGNDLRFGSDDLSGSTLAVGEEVVHLAAHTCRIEPTGWRVREWMR